VGVAVAAAAAVAAAGTDGKNSLFNKAIIIDNNHLLNTSGQPNKIIAIHLKTIALSLSIFSVALCFSVFPLAFLSLVAVFVVAVHGCGVERRERKGLASWHTKQNNNKTKRTQDFLYTIKTFALHFSFVFTFPFTCLCIHILMHIHLYVCI